tara:strand:- start:15289 stop:15510 length:222 start_codon:yes stop_codon:yes gene_type:complete
MRKILKNIDWEIAIKSALLISFVAGFYVLLSTSIYINFIYGFIGGFIGWFILFILIKLVVITKMAYLNKKKNI